jgi:hypothetical protein
MPDPRSVMKEFRFLDQKRQAEGLSADEEVRYGELRDLVGGEVGSAKARPGFDVSAAAARLRESLMPAGLRNRPPPTPEPAPEPLGEIDLPAEEPLAVDAAYAEQPLAPAGDAPAEVAVDEGFFDPGALAAEGDAYDPSAPPYDPNAAAYDPNAATYDPNAAAYDPNAAAYDPNAAAYDPNAAAYDPNAAAYDPNAAAYDPNAAAYDPNAPAYDPNAAAYDPNAPAYDPNAAAYDPNAPAYDPNAPAYDPNAAAYDPNAPAYDPNAAAYDPNAPAYDPNAPAYDPNAAAYDPNAGALDFDPNAPVQDPNAMGWADTGPSAELDVPAAFEPGPDATTAPDGSPLPNLGDELTAGAQHDETDWSAVSAEVASASDAPPGEPPYAPAPGGEYDASSWDSAAVAQPEGLQPAPAVPAADDLSPFPAAGWSGEPDLEPAPQAPVEFGNYDEAGALVTGEAQPDLEALLPFDPAAEAAIGPDMARAFGGGPDMELPGGVDVPDRDEFHAAEGMVSREAPEWQPEPQAVDQGFELASGGSFDASADAAAPEWAAPAQAGGTPWDAPAPGEDLAAPDEYAGGPAPDPAAEAGSPAQPALVGAPAGEGAQLLDFSGGELTAAGADDGMDLAWTGAAAGGPGAAGPEVPEALESQPALPPLDLDAGAEAPVDPGLPADLEPLPQVEEEIPTIDAEDIIEAEPIDVGELAAPPAPAPETFAYEPEPEPAAYAPEPAAYAPEPEPEPAAYAPEPAAYAPEPEPEPVPEAPAYAAEPPLEVIETPPEPEVLPALPVNEYLVHGVHRVVVHTLEGQVKRGVLEEADLSAPELPLAATQGGPIEGISTAHVKAIFFMLAPGEQAAAPYGSRVRVTFRDGRQVAGLSPDYREGAFGFFMTPADARTSTARIWVYAAAVKLVAVS